MDDITITNELHICAGMVGRLEHPRGNVICVDVFSMDEKQFVVDALHVGHDTSQLFRSELRDINGQFLCSGTIQVCRRPPEGIENEVLFHRPGASGFIEQSLQGDSNDDRSASGQAAASFSIAASAIRPSSALH